MIQQQGGASVNTGANPYPPGFEYLAAQPSPGLTAANGGTPTMTQLSKPQQQAPAGPNIYNTSANAYNNAVGATTGAMASNAMQKPVMATSHGYSAPSGSQYTPSNASAAMAAMGPLAVGNGYSAAQMGPIADVMAGQFAGMDIAPYMNPYLDNVVDRTATDMERGRLIQQNQADDAMQAAGAFGGSRHGIANAETNRGYYDMLGNTLGGLRNQGYQNAQGAAFQDIGNRMQADLANQNTGLQSGMFNTGQQNEALRTGANNALQASLSNSQLGTQVNLANANNSTNVNMSNAAGQNAMNQARFAAANQAAQFNAQAANQNSMFNAGNANQFNQNQYNNALAGAGQLGGLSQQGFNMGNTISGQQAQAGAQAQALQQQLIDAAKGQFGGYTGAGNAGLAGLQSGVSAIPAGSQNTTEKNSPGLFGVLGSLAGI